MFYYTANYMQSWTSVHTTIVHASPLASGIGHRHRHRHRAPSIHNVHRSLSVPNYSESEVAQNVCYLASKLVLALGCPVYSTALYKLHRLLINSWLGPGVPPPFALCCSCFCAVAWAPLRSAGKPGYPHCFLHDYRVRDPDEGTPKRGRRYRERARKNGWS